MQQTIRPEQELPSIRLDPIYFGQGICTIELAALPMLLELPLVKPGPVQRWCWLPLRDRAQSRSP